ncbi:MAG: PhzF family phenazine biosynthesis protein [Gammaproteobacteria bacterium]
MPTLSLYHVDAFADRAFAGNPAAVVPLSTWMDDDVLTRIAAENNLSETAFFVRSSDSFHIRWFTPVREVELCGHATLATAFVITRFVDSAANELVFSSASGELRVRPASDKFELDFPARPPQAMDDALAGRIAKALGQAPIWCGQTRNADPDSDKLLAVLDSDASVKALTPDSVALGQLPGQGVIVTARGEDCDFVSRYFVPKLGIPEDPVTGSAHCTLVPYWAEVLDKDDFFARQVSARGGELWCRLVGDRVRIAGRCVLYLEGRITI